MHWQNWSPNQEYHIGDSVVYQGRTYHIIQPHISQADWTPSECPALWGQGNPVGSEIGRHPGPQDRHSPPPYNRGGQGGMPGMGFDQHRDAPKEGHYVAPQPEHPREIPQPEHTRGIPEPAPNRGFPEPDHNRAPPQPERNRGFPEPERNRGFPEPDRHRGFPDPEHHRGPPDYEPGNWDHDRDRREKEDDRDRDRREREDDRDREYRRDREYGSRDRQRDYGGEDREMRGGHQRGHGDGEYRNPVKYNSSAEWIDDARRRTREVNMNGPGERIYWLLAEPGQIPKHAIQAGEDRNGDPTFVSRNFHEGGLHVGWAGLRHAAISYGGREIPLTTFEVLVGDPRGVRWAASKKRDGRPIEAGYEANGKPLWICQTLVGDQILAGKTASWESGGYIANDGKEEAVPEYNVLCHA